VLWNMCTQDNLILVSQSLHTLHTTIQYNSSKRCLSNNKFEYSIPRKKPCISKDIHYISRSTNKEKSQSRTQKENNYFMNTRWDKYILFPLSHVNKWNRHSRKMCSQSRQWRTYIEELHNPTTPRQKHQRTY
jgi:hypothetical protein